MEDRNLPVLDEKTYVKETFTALWESLHWVLLSGFFFMLVSLPAVLLILFDFPIPGVILGCLTSGPGWIAMLALITRILLRTPGTSPLDYFRYFGRYYRRGSGLGALMAVPLATGMLNLPLLQQTPVPQVVWVGLGANLAGFVLLTALYIYAVPQIVLYNIGVKVALQNGFIMAARYLPNTIGLIALPILLTIIIARVSWLLLVLLPPVWSVFVINNCRMVLRIELGDK